MVIPSENNNNRHPVIEAAYLHADQKTPPTSDHAYDLTHWAVQKDLYLTFAAQGLFSLIVEMENNAGIQAPLYDLEEAYVLLALIDKEIVGFTGSLISHLAGSGAAFSTNEATMYISKARTFLEKSKIIEHQRRNIPMIGVVGAISSGKGTVGEILQNKFGGLHLPLSERLREVSLAMGGDNTFPREILRQVNDVLKPTYGKDIFVRWTMDRAQRLAAMENRPVVSMDGFRSVEEAQTFKNSGGILIGVQTNQLIRFQRLVQRGRYGDDGWGKFLESEAIENEWIEPIFEICDFTIENSGGMDNLEQQVDIICAELDLV